MGSGRLKAIVQTHFQLLQDQNRLFEETNHRDHRNIIDKTELVGHLMIEALLTKTAFLDLHMGERELEQISKAVYGWIKNEVKYDKRLVKRVIGKLFSTGKYQDIQLIQEEILSLVRTMYGVESTSQHSLEVGDLQIDFGEDSSYIHTTLHKRQQQDINQSRQSFVAPQAILTDESSIALHSLLIAPKTSSFMSTIQLEALSGCEAQVENPQVNSNVLCSQFSKLDLNDPIQYYLQCQITHTCHELSQFCHQMRLPPPEFQQASTTSQMLSIRCRVNVGASEWNRFNDRVYEGESQASSCREGKFQSSKRVLQQIYRRNVDVWEKFKAIKRRKGIST